MSCVRRFLNSCSLALVTVIRGVRGGVRTNVSGTAFSFGLVAGVSLDVGAVEGSVEGPKAGDTRLEAGTV
jgi:hypothetical protein